MGAKPKRPAARKAAAMEAKPRLVPLLDDQFDRNPVDEVLRLQAEMKDPIQPLEVLKDFERRCRIEGDFVSEYAKPKENVREVLLREKQVELTKFFQSQIADNLEALIPRLDEEGGRLLWRLIRSVRHEAWYEGFSPTEATITAIRMSERRALVTKKMQERRDKLRPLVEAKAEKHPSEKAPKIITLLLQGEKFRKDFAHYARGTLNTDATVIMMEKNFNPGQL